MQAGVLEWVGRNLPNPALLLRPLGDREAILSSRIEGTYATARELLLFEVDPRTPESDADRSNDWFEVFNCRRALHLCASATMPITRHLIRELHRVLLEGARGRERHPGRFREIQVAIGTNHRFLPPPPEKLADCLEQLETFMTNSNSPTQRLVDCFLVHYQFEAIHPFEDGNGRTGRMLLVIMLQAALQFTKPWLYMSDYFERHRHEYIDRLFAVSTRGEWTGWIEFCLKGVVEQARTTHERCQRLQDLKQAYHDRLSKLRGAGRLYQIVEWLFEQPLLRITRIAERLRITYPTAARDVERLTEAGIMAEFEDVRPKTYFAPEIYDAAFGDLEAPRT